mmetsp:Transcript_66169/g.138219  ORF Transcript_66169/g.138219 Transcript_66169/m.138219 type:complete len:397 (+) Transcript_66169:718-1908(+)
MEGCGLESLEARYEYIARTIAIFGRYSDNRPRELFVDGDGSMYLSQLYEYWGRKEGLTQKEIQDAIRTHMFHEDGGLRFSIDNDRNGKLLVKVAPSRRAQQEARIRPGRMSARPLALANEAHSSRRNDVVDLTEDTPRDRIDMSLSELIAGYGYGQGFKQQVRSVPHRPMRLRGSIATTLGAERQQNNDSLQVRIQRWLSWVVKVGHQKLSIERSGERFRLSEVVREMSRTRPEYGCLNEEEMMQMLEEHDDVGRFHVEDGWLSKVPRERRRRRAAMAQGQPEAPSRGRSPDRAAWPGRNRVTLTPAAEVHRIASRSRSRQSVTGDTDEDDDLNERMARVDMEGSGPPSLPPGAGWTEYNSPEGDQWWAYEGRRGKWMFCPAQGHTAPEPWPTDDD